MVVSGSVWKNRTWVKMFSAYTISTFGDWFDIIAIAVLIAYRWQASAMEIALIPVMYALPGILLGSVAGVLADRWKKLKVMIVADLLVALVTVGIFLAPNIYWVLPLLMVRATLGVFNIPAQQALTRQVVTEEQLLQATSMNGAVNQASKVAGPLLGASVLAVVSPGACILLNAVCRVFSAVMLMTVRHAEEGVGQTVGGSQEAAGSHVAAAESQGKESFGKAWREGWKVVLQRNLLLHSMMFSLFGLLAVQLIDFQFPTLFREIAPTNESLIGWSIASSGLGAVVSILLMNRVKNMRYGWALGGGYLLIGVGFGWMGLLPRNVDVIWPVVSGIVTGVGNGMFIVAFNFLLQKESPKEAVGRVFGISNSLGSFVVILAPLIGGLLIERFGVAEVFQIIGLSVAVIGGIGILFQALIWPRKRDAIAAPAGAPVDSGR